MSGIFSKVRPRPLLIPPTDKAPRFQGSFIPLLDKGLWPWLRPEGEPVILKVSGTQNRLPSAEYVVSRSEEVPRMRVWVQMRVEEKPGNEGRGC